MAWIAASGVGAAVNERMKRELARFQKADIDPALLDALKREMAAAQPEIQKAIREREQRAAEYRAKPTVLFA